VVCFQPCTRLCPRQHPCHKQCAQPCGDCHFPVSNVELPCGHVQSSVPWCDLSNFPFCLGSLLVSHMLEKLDQFFCAERVTRTLPGCEHTVVMRCSDDVTQASCSSRCDLLLPCCSRLCTARCSDCQSLNAANEEGSIPRLKHSNHPCQRTLCVLSLSIITSPFSLTCNCRFCEHRCQNNCSEDHSCTTECHAPCRQICSHTRCKRDCAVPCAVSSAT
jgi:hypothetical protein